MGQLTVRNLSAQIVRALKQRAVGHGRSAEAEHREILREALLEEHFDSPPARKPCAGGCARPLTAPKSSAPTAIATRAHDRVCRRRERCGEMARDRDFLRCGG